ncbi:sigma-54 dependent transcriptional regulator [Botrimarina sp.]|uniref:sigma-54 interaction domain-containing protein n=1 Tax=Botrimarina sp. TaxID=2795802 RepID=UPI0032EF5738
MKGPVVQALEPHVGALPSGAPQPPRPFSPADPCRELLGDSPAMRELKRLIRRAGPTDKPILIQGESGTGKELIARALHRASRVADKPLVVVNCAALPEQLLESELFGHERGAFTGAVTTKPGLFEVADGGTLLIDEIGELAGSLQAKLLRVLEDGRLRRVGSTRERRVRVRVLTATNRDIAAEVEQHRFREDLYYRIDVLTLRAPPLRSRHNDVPLLARRFAGAGWEIDADALEAICNYSWPGNVRQLINAIERAKILAESDRIELCNLPEPVAQCREAAATDGRRPPGALAESQRRTIEQALAECGGNKLHAARRLGVSRRSLYRLLEKHGIAGGR